MSDALPLPPRPNLEQYKKLAKDFQSACKSSEAGAIRNAAKRWLKGLTRLQNVEITASVQPQIEREAARIEQRWNKLKLNHEGAARCTLSATQLFIAREHGFVSWPRFSQHIELLESSHSSVSDFEAAADAIVTGDQPALKRLLHDDPELARARSTREHRSTLLHYVSANGVEDFRQKTPKNVVEITKLLLAAGADVNAESDAYGGGSTTLGLVATSIHPQVAGVQIPLLQFLLDAGARLDQPSAGGNGQSIVNGCLANGQPQAAQFLANYGAPVDLEAAGALGRLDIVKTYFDETDGFKPQATKSQMESAFLYACGYGRTEVVEFLLDNGIDPSSSNAQGQTGLHWAAYGANAEMVKLLLQRSARVAVRDKGFNAQPLDVALHVWDNNADKATREHCYEVVALLVRAGARLDPQQWRNPDKEGQAEPGGMLEKIRNDPRMLAALGEET
jgi:ankyrin repeat protein